MIDALRSDDPLRRALWIALGIGLLGDAFLVCVRMGWLLHSPLGLLFPVAAGAGLLFIGVDALRQHPPASLLDRVLLALIAAVVIVLVILNLVPPIARDELTYHLAVPALYLRAGHSIELPFIVHAYFPMLLEMFYTPLLANLPEQAPKFFHLACGIATVALVHLYLSTRVRSVVALGASLLLLSTPTLMALAASAYVDLGLLLYTAVAVIGLLRWARTAHPSDLIASALGVGCAASVKYNGLVVIALLGACVLVIAPRKRWWDPLVAAASFGLIAALPLLPWLLKNALDTGNPFFPLFNTVLGGRPIPHGPSIDVFTYRQVLYGETWIDILLVPLRVFLTGRDGNPAQFDGVLNPIWLLGFAALGLATAGRREQALAGFAALFLAITLCAAVFRSRYVIPILIPLAILTAEWLEAQWQQRRELIGIVAVAAFAFNVAHGVLLWQRVDPLTYVLGQEDRAQYIARFVPEYPVAVYANAHLPQQSGVYLAFLGGRGYYWNRSYTYDAAMPGTRLCDAIRQSQNAADVVERLRAEGITHIAAVDPLLDQFARDNLKPVEYERWQAFVLNHLRPLFAQNGVGLYAMVGA